MKITQYYHNVPTKEFVVIHRCCNKQKPTRRQAGWFLILFNTLSYYVLKEQSVQTAH